MSEVLNRRKEISCLLIYLDVRLPEIGFQLHHYWPNDCGQIISSLQALILSSVGYR